MFTTQAFVKITLNDKEENSEVFSSMIKFIKEEVIKIGYDVYISLSITKKSYVNEFYVFTFYDNNRAVPMIYITEDFEDIQDNWEIFDCKNNLKAFFKIIAMRDDTDMNQYFVDEEGAEWVNLGMRIEPGSLEKCLTEKQVIAFNSPKTHRASAKEIFDFFEKYKDSEL